jgi:hypothetical protein
MLAKASQLVQGMQEPAEQQQQRVAYLMGAIYERGEG